MKTVIRTVTRALILCSLLSGCASHQLPFKKGTPGYEVGKSIGKDGFTLTTDLGGKGDDKYSVSYAFRAVAEECLARTFEHFDVAVLDTHTFEGYCYKGADKPGIGVEFGDRGLDARPQHFVIDTMNGKTNTQIHPGDEILEVDGKKLTSVGAMKAAAYRASIEDRKTLSLKIRRDGKDIDVKEPLALFKNSTMGSTQLDLMRSRVP